MRRKEGGGGGTYNHDRKLSKGVHICDPVLRLVLALSHFDSDELVRDVQFFAGDKDWYTEAMDFDDHRGLGTEKLGVEAGKDRVKRVNEKRNRWGED